MIFPSSFDLSALDGTNGFVINGIDSYDQSGWSVSSAGDVNGDGFDDLIIGASLADPNGNERAGESYVVFGNSGGFTASLDLSTLDGSNGFVINGIDAYDYSGWSVSSAGDVNGDGFDDLIIGAPSADPNGNGSAGKSYVVFGSGSGFTASLDLSNLNGSNGFVLNGIDANDLSGVSVSSAGDVNGDGIDDLIIGARRADPNGNGGAGESYVVFGNSGGFAASLDLSTLNGSNGFVINGVDAGDFSGRSVSSAGDVNGDGFDDLIIGAYFADPNGNVSAGESYVVFGNSGGFTASLDLSNLNGSNGFVINGIDAYDYSGWSVSSAGDVNGDGIDDLIIGADFADPNGNSNAGESYVVFGSSSGFTASFDLSTLNGSNGFVINGIDGSDHSGSSVSSAGDVNGDGIDDLIIGADGADPNGNGGAGESYVVFGSGTGFTASLDLSNLNGSNGFVLNGIDAGDLSGLSVSSAGDVNGDGFDDLIIGAPNGNGLAGESYVVFGMASNQLPDAVNDDLTADEDSSVSGNVLADNGNGADIDPNGDPLTVTEVNGNAADVGTQITLASGALLTLNADGTFSYDPNGQFESLAVGETDTDSFTYTIDDGNGGTDTATATITLNGANDAPVANDDSGVGFSTDEDTPFTTANVLANDTDADTSDVLTVTNLDTTGTLGLVTDNGDGTFSYDPNGQFEALNDGQTATDSFTYTVSDGNGGTHTATVEITIAGATDTPTPILGTPGGDVLNGTSGNDIILGFQGNDLLLGNQGDDFLLGGGGNDFLLGNQGDDLLFGGEGNDFLQGGEGDDFLFSEQGNNVLLGGEGNDLLQGGLETDFLDGGEGSDFLRGGFGNDVLSGGSALDIFVFAAGEGTDTIIDFEMGVDLIGLADGLSFGALTFSGSNIVVTATNEVLASLMGVDTTTLNAGDFITV